MSLDFPLNKEQNRMPVDSQGSLFGEASMAPPARESLPDLQAIRERLDRLLKTLRASETMPLSDRDLNMWQTVVPNMTRWLPDEEADGIRYRVRTRDGAAGLHCLIEIGCLQWQFASHAGRVAVEPERASPKEFTSIRSLWMLTTGR